MSDDKYMRAADAVVDYFGRYGINARAFCNIIREEIERPEPLEVGVMHRFMRAEKSNKFMVEVCFDGDHIYTAVTSFPAIPDGEVRDE